MTDTTETGTAATDTTTAVAPLLRISTDALPARDRLAFSREVFGRHVLRLDVEPLRRVPLRVELQIRAFPGLTIVDGSMSGSHSRRTRELTADGNDDLGITLNLSDRFLIRQRNEEAMLGEGDVHVATCAEPAEFVKLSGLTRGLRVPRSALGNRVRDIDDALIRGGRRRSEALRLLIQYTGALAAAPPSDPTLQALAVSHVYDLAALVIADSGGRPPREEHHGLRAARRHAVKADISAQLANPDLNLGAAASRLALTPRYVQRLFEDEGTTFSEYLLLRRLERVHDALHNSTTDRITTLALEAGFGDLSHFNRNFRRRYGATPSDIRRRIS